jgi:uncharacterized membrane protein YphA (DoxX/SURF4 family)
MKLTFLENERVQQTGLTAVRLFVGFFMIYHGWEVFNQTKMNDYLQWDLFKHSSNGRLMVYGGKAAELVAGALLFFGFFTRPASLVLIVIMSYISFFVGHGKIWYEDQHPFLFVLLGIIFLFAGGGKWSVDHYLLNKKQLNR